MDTDKLMIEAVRDGIREAIKSKLGGYGSPIDKLLVEVIVKHEDDFRSLLSQSVISAIGDANFREEIAAATRHRLAQLLVQRFGGELEKQVNALKSDPSTRARITVAIEEIVKGAA